MLVKPNHPYSLLGSYNLNNCLDDEAKVLESHGVVFLQTSKSAQEMKAALHGRSTVASGVDGISGGLYSRAHGLSVGGRLRPTHDTVVVASHTMLLGLLGLCQGGFHGAVQVATHLGPTNSMTPPLLCLWPEGKLGDP